MVSDYDIYKSLIFAQITLQKEEFKLYRKMFNFMYKEVKKPDIYIFLYQSSERLLENIKKRSENIGGFLRIKSSKDKGTKIVFEGKLKS